MQKGEGGYAGWIIVDLHGLREYLDHLYRGLLDVLQEMSGIVLIFGLLVDELQDFIPVCAQIGPRDADIGSPIAVNPELLEPGDVQVLDATGFDLINTSQHFAQRTNYIFGSLKKTALVDCSTSGSLDIHCSMKRPHDIQIC